MRYLVIEAWQRSHDNPICLRAGDTAVPDGRQECWEGFRWPCAPAPDGREGRVPDELLCHDGNGWHARRDYSALELRCAAGQMLDGMEAAHGWIWCRAWNGEEGWVPRRSLSPVADGLPASSP